MLRTVLLALAFAVVANAQTKAPRIDVLNTQFTLDKGFRQVVEFRLDEPIICPQADRECAVVVTITNSDPKRVTMDTCVIKWLWNEWHQSRFLTIAAIENFVNDQIVTVTLKTEPAISRSEYYTSFDAKDITLTARPRPSADCSGTGDPHYVTFDSYYWHVYYAGRYVAYKSLVREFEVQVETYSYPYAMHCGFAAKEGNDIVVVNACSGSVRHRRTCGSQECLNGGFPKVGITGSGSSGTYIVSFKSGAQVRGDFWGQYMNFYTTAPGVDYGNTVGICGNFNGNKNDDAPMYVAQKPEDLWASQKPARDLFAWFPTGPIVPLDVLPPHATKCVYTEPEFIRPILNQPSVEDITNLIKSGNRDEPNKDNFFVEPDFVPSPMDERQARLQCDTTIKNSVVAKTCQRVIGNFPLDGYILNCVNDLVRTGDVSFIEDSLATMEAECAAIGNRDQGTWENDNNGNPIEPSIELQKTLCPNACSGHGLCEKSQCRCDDGFSGVDCSINKGQAPNITSIEEPFCDSRGLKACDREISVRGTNFWNSDNLACYFGEEQTKALFLGSQEVLCALPASVTQAGATTVTRQVSVATDFRSRSSLTYTWYDSVCTVCSPLTGCAPNPQSCTIGGVCYLATQSQAENVCLQCQPSVSASTWSYSYASHEDCGPKFELNSYTAKIVSEVVSGYEVIRMSAGNPLVKNDAANKVKYTLARSESAFTINADTGVITTTRALKVSEIPQGFNSLISVTATDSAGNVDQTTVVVLFVQTNQNPLFKEAGYTLTVSEGASVGTKVGQVTAEDPDSNPDWKTLSYEWFSQEQGHEADFVVNAADGTITVGAPLDFETKKTYNLHLKAKDAGSQFHVTTVTIVVTNVDEAPTKVTLSGLSVEENKPIGTAVGNLTSEDPEGGPFAYTVDNANFRVVGSTLVTAAVFNFEATASFQVRIRSTDTTGKFLEVPFTIQVVDVNERPYGIALGTTTFDEDAKVDSVLTSITVKDDDAKQVVGCSLSFSSEQTFEVSGKNLVLVKPLDFESKKVYEIEVVCVDDGTPALQSESAKFTFTIVDKNDAPEDVTMTVAGGRIAENATVGSVVGQLSAVDHDQDAGAITFAIGSDNTKFGLNLPARCSKDGASGAMTCVVDVRLNEALDYENDKQETITVTASDSKGLSSVTKVDIDVSNVNEAPTGVEWIDGKNSIQERSATGTVIGQIKAVDADVDAVGATYTFELIGGDGIIALRQARRAVSGPVVTVVVADESMLDHETHPVVAFQIKVTDAGGLSVIADAQVVVADEPVKMWANSALNSEFVVEENTAVGTNAATIVMTGFDREADLTYTLSLSDNSNGQFSVSGDKIVVAGPIDYESATTGFVVVRATYARKNAASNVVVPAADESKINFQVKNVAEAPYFTSSKYMVVVSDDENVGTSLRVEPAIFAIDPEAKGVTYAISGATNPKGIFEITNAGVIRVVRMPSVAGVRKGTYPVEVVAFDGSQSSSVVVVVVVEDGCSSSPCLNGAVCQDEFNSYSCKCVGNFEGGSCESVVTLQSSSDKMSSGAVGGVVAAVIVAVLVVLVVLFVVFRKKTSRRDTELGLLGKHSFDNPTFVSPSRANNDSMPEYAPVVRFTPGVANPIYDWYQPDMNRNECNDYLLSQGEGAFVVRDSKATPGWHMLGVKSSNQVVHDKIRMNEDSTYTLVPTTSSRAQPSFPDIPSLVQYYASNKTDVHYALAFSNPIYDNHMMRAAGAGQYAAGNGAAPVLSNDPSAPAVPIKQRDMDAVQAIASEFTEDIYTNTEEAKLVVSTA